MMTLDELIIRIKFLIKMHKRLNLKAPSTFNEKLQWLKLHDRRPEYSRMVDKVEAKKWAEEILGPGHIIPDIAVYDSIREVPWESLPERFVMKCAHDSGGVAVCGNRAAFDVRKARRRLSRRSRKNYYHITQEWPYKSVRPRILVEEFLSDGDPGGLRDYKFFCFGGRVHSVMICVDRGIGDPKFYFFDREWNLLRLNIRGKQAPEGFTVSKPEGIDEMFSFAERLSAGIPFARVDLYNVSGKIYFGELTLYPKSGYDSNLLPETDVLFGSLLSLDSLQSK